MWLIILQGMFVPLDCHVILAKCFILGRSVLYMVIEHSYLPRIIMASDIVARIHPFFTFYPLFSMCCRVLHRLRCYNFNSFPHILINLLLNGPKDLLPAHPQHKSLKVHKKFKISYFSRQDKIESKNTMRMLHHFSSRIGLLSIKLSWHLPLLFPEEQEHRPKNFQSFSPHVISFKFSLTLLTAAVHGVTKSRTWLSDWTELLRAKCVFLVLWYYFSTGRPHKLCTLKIYKVSEV